MSHMSRDDTALAPQEPKGGPGGIGAGASIRNPYGDRWIENLNPGDLVVTRTEGLQPVKDVVIEPRSRVDATLAPPIRIAARAFGPMMPQRALLLAPDQPVRVPAHLIDAGSEHPTLRLKAQDLVGQLDGVNAATLFDLDAPLVWYRLVFERPQSVMVSGVILECRGAKTRPGQLPEPLGTAGTPPTHGT
ncbi:Hint domain-containing protein [Dinoroseobacter sp. S124A]|uniref:Hint domain-containing protein n=1 Tax=Dinoroseobacter sp. S124A TaxID=3415128 RepID=UPI003C79C3A5